MQEILSRPLRSALTGSGTVIGVGSFVCIVSLAATANAQIVDELDALRATEIRVQDLRDDGEVGTGLPANTDQLASMIDGVVAGGRHWSIATADYEFQAKPGSTGGAELQTVDLVAMSKGALDAFSPQLVVGQTLSSAHYSTNSRVVLLGSAAADVLSVTVASPDSAVFINGLGYAVIGVAGAFDRDPTLLRSVVVPDTTAAQLFPSGDRQLAQTAFVTTRPGAARTVARQLPLALRPEDPESLRAVVAPDPERLRQAIGRETSALLLVLGGVALFVGTLGIASAALTSLVERRGQIGLRRALGARPVHIVGQLLLEAAATGALAGLFGAALGLIAAILLSGLEGWVPVLEPWSLAAPVLGAVSGLVAGGYPAAKAAKLEPAEVLRDGV